MKPYYLVAVIALLIVVSSSATAQENCSQIGCVNGLTLHLPSQMTWPPGAYAFSVMTEDKTLTCTGVLPFPSCDAEMACNDEDLMVMQNGCALPPDAHSFGPMIQIDGEPEKVRLTVSRDGITLIDQTFAPLYNTSQPNGPKCGPVCRSASLNVTLSAQSPALLETGAR